MRPTKKLKADTIQDEQGRLRFHGAFTGGFSAGFYNTVGSVEGFKPTAFVSSRSNRANVQRQTARDLVDDDDGIIGGHLSTKQDFDTFGSHIGEVDAKRADGLARHSGSVIPGPIPSELIVPSAISMGKKLLAKMGWKEGQGVGPRVKSKQPTKATTSSSSSSASASSAAAITSTILHAGVDVNTLPSAALDLFGQVNTQQSYFTSYLILTPFQPSISNHTHNSHQISSSLL